MGIFGRMKDVLTANVNDMIDKAENPDKMLKQIIREIDEGIDQCKRDLAKVLADAKRMEREVDAKAGEVSQWEERAQAAVAQDNDELARKALERKLAHEKELATLQEQADQTRHAADSMQENIKLLSDRLAEARAKRTALVARAQAARNEKKAQEQVRDLESPLGAMDKLDKFERKVEDLEAEAGAAAAVVDAGNDVEKEFKQMEQNLAVESELAALKAKRKKK